jgi:hypothetical protein
MQPGNGKGYRYRENEAVDEVAEVNNEDWKYGKLEEADLSDPIVEDAIAGLKEAVDFSRR